MVDPWSRESRGFGFVTMSTVEEADRCIKYLDRSVLEGRVIMVEKVEYSLSLYYMIRFWLFYFSLVANGAHNHYKSCMLFAIKFILFV